MKKAMGVAVLAILSAAVVTSTPRHAVNAASSTITGSAIQDFNSNGVMDATISSGRAKDVPLAGVVVRVFDASGTEVGTANTDATGTYSVSVAVDPGTDLRVEFTRPSAGPFGTLQSSFVGSDSGTTIQFVKAGDSGVDVAFSEPSQFCQNNPYLAVSRLCTPTRTGDNPNQGVLTSPSVFVTRYDGGPYTSGNSLSIYANWTATKAGTVTDTGSILGMAWDPTAGRIYNAAYVRRLAEVYESEGKPRPGAIFVTTPNGRQLTQPTGGTTQFLVDLETLLDGDQFSNSTPGQLGFIPTNADRKLQFSADGTADGGIENDGVDSDLLSGRVGVYEEVGQTGIGDIEADGEGNLYVVSLYDKNLYKVGIPANGSAPTLMTSLGDITSGVTCTRGVGRPFGITRWRDALYLGVVCDGSQDYDPANPFAVKNSNLSFTVRAFSLVDGTWSTFYGPQPLAMSKGQPDGTSANWAHSRVWNPWTDRYDLLASGTNRDRNGVRPSPMLSDIEFDIDGSMILGFRDRNGDRLGAGLAENPIGGATSQGNMGATGPSGDIYRVCRTGAGYTAADYTFEGGSGCATQSGGSSVNPEQEYYSGDKYFSYHMEISNGMVDQVPGFPDAIMTSFDPYDPPSNADGATWYSGGTTYLKNATGRGAAFPNIGSGVIFYSSTAGVGINAGGFDKTNGMSDIEALCDQAPVQIGNRVWLDADLDGIQDPGETPVAGVTVRLYDATGTILLGTAITDANGEYYFSSTLTSEAAGGDGDRAGGGLVVGAQYLIRLDNPADYASGGPLNGYGLVSPDARDVASSLDDLIDSDASPVAGYPQITTASIRPGVNDHSYDVGFGKPAVSVGDYVWWDADKDGIQDAGEKGIPNVTLTIAKADGSPVVDVNGQPVTTTTTDADGYYSFGKLPLGQYRVTVTSPVGYAATLPNVGSDAGVDSSTGSALSRVMSESGDRDASLDFGFYPSENAGTTPEGSASGGGSTQIPGNVKISVGDYVWFDSNRDGIQDPKEKPISGVTLSITRADGLPVVDVNGNPVTTTKTDAKGKYSFDNLPPGQYVVTVVPPAGLTATKSGVGSDRGKDSSTGSAMSRSMTVNGDRDPTLDFGFFGPRVSVGNIVWRDKNGDGIQQVSERGLSGAILTLRTPSGKAVTDVFGRRVSPLITRSDGRYLFSNLPPGRYVVKITYPLGTRPTTAERGIRAKNSSSFSAKSVNLTRDGQADLTLDFGVVGTPMKLPATL